MRIYIFLFSHLILLSIFVISCTTNSATTLNSKPINTLESFTPTPIVTPTMYITAISNDQLGDVINLEKIIQNSFGGKLECYHSILKFEKEREAAGNPIFIEKEADFGSSAIWSSAIAENENLTVKALIACIPLSPENTSCRDSVIIKDSVLNKTFEINFYTQSNNRPTYMMGWIGNDILTFSQNNSPATSTIIAIDVKNRVYIYLSLYFHWCE